MGTQMKLSSRRRDFSTTRVEIQVERLAAHLRNDDWLPALKDAARDAFARLVVRTRRATWALSPSEARTAQLARAAAVIERHDGRDRAVVFLKRLEGPHQRGSEVQARAERGAHLEQVGELAHLGSGRAGHFGSCYEHGPRSAINDSFVASASDL